VNAVHSSFFFRDHERRAGGREDLAERAPLVLTSSRLASPVSAGARASFRSGPAAPPGTDLVAAAGRALADPRLFPLSALYAAVLMAILVGHELGHYLTCRRYGIRATLPFFLPGPPFIGTFGRSSASSRPSFQASALRRRGQRSAHRIRFGAPALAAGLAFSRVAPFVPPPTRSPSANRSSSGSSPPFSSAASPRARSSSFIRSLRRLGRLLVTASTSCPRPARRGTRRLRRPRTEGAVPLPRHGRRPRRPGVFFHVTWLVVAAVLLFFEFKSKLRLNHPRSPTRARRSAGEGAS